MTPQTGFTKKWLYTCWSALAAKVGHHLSARNPGERDLKIARLPNQFTYAIPLAFLKSLAADTHATEALIDEHSTHRCRTLATVVERKCPPTSDCTGRLFLSCRAESESAVV